MMWWFRKWFQKQSLPSARPMVAEFTEFELSESHKILLNKENMVGELLEHISEQQQLIRQYEEELRIWRSGYISDTGNTKIIEEGNRFVS